MDADHLTEGLSVTFHPAPPRATAADPIPDYVNAAAEARVPGAQITVTGAVPYEQVPHMPANMERGRAYVVPILQPNAFTCEPAEVTFVCSSEQLARLHDGDVVLATRLGATGAPVHSLGSITSTEGAKGHTVTAQIALTRFEGTASLVGYEVLVVR